MKFGHVNDVEESQRLLYWALNFVLSPYFDEPIDHWLKDILAYDGGLGGDPGWEIEYIPEANGVGVYRVWCDPDIFGVESAEAIYSAKQMYDAVHETLLALGDAYPEKADEVRVMINRYKLPEDFSELVTKKPA